MPNYKLALTYSYYSGLKIPIFGSENSKPPWTQLSLSRIIKLSNFAQDLDQ